MSGQQNQNVWHTARSRQAQASVRSNNTSPQSFNASQPVRSDRSATPSNAWTQRVSQSAERPAAGSSERQMSPSVASSPVERGYTPLNGFNSADVKELLGRAVSEGSYKPLENGISTKNSSGSKASSLANGQSFWVVLAKQVAAAENGG